MKTGKYLSLLALTALLVLNACSLISPAPSTINIEEQVAQTIAAGDAAIVAAGDAATAVMEQAKKEISDEQTVTAAVEKAVSEALTAAAPPPSDTPVPPTETPDVTATPSETPTETPTETLTPSPTIKASPTQCFVVMDSWCLAHQGCATMQVKNKTGSNATVRIWLNDGSVDSTLYSSPGVLCTLMLRPAKYNYTFNYCGEQTTGSHALNDKWYIELKCP